MLRDEALVPLGRVGHRRAEQLLDLARELPPVVDVGHGRGPHRHLRRRTRVELLGHGRDSDVTPVRPGRPAASTEG